MNIVILPSDVVETDLDIEKVKAAKKYFRRGNRRPIHASRDDHRPHDTDETEWKIAAKGRRDFRAGMNTPRGTVAERPNPVLKIEAEPREDDYDRMRYYGEPILGW